MFFLYQKPAAKKKKSDFLMDFFLSLVANIEILFTGLQNFYLPSEKLHVTLDNF